MTKLIYLASPYTHVNKKKMQTRLVQVSKLAGLLYKKGHHVLPPICSSYLMAKYGKIEGTAWPEWKALDLNYVDRCDEVWISMLDNEWMKSVGMYEEAQYAHSKGIPVRLVDRKGRVLNTPVRDILKQFELAQLFEGVN